MRQPIEAGGICGSASQGVSIWHDYERDSRAAITWTRHLWPLSTRFGNNRPIADIEIVGHVRPMRLALILSVVVVSAHPAGTGNVYSRVVGGTGSSEPRLSIPRGTYAARVCAGSHLPPREAIGEPVSLFPARGVVSVTGDLPFVALPPSGRRQCDLVLQGRPLASTDGTGARFDYATCSVLVTDGAPQRIVIAPRRGRAPANDHFVLAECVYRIAMYVEGYRGALAEPTATMFYDRTNSVHATRPWVGPKTTGVYWAIALRCGDLRTVYYNGDLSSSLGRTCPKGMELLNRP